MADKGWIKIYRKLQDSAIWTSDVPFDFRSAWIDLIMMANIKDKQVIYRGTTITVRRGEVYTSIRKLAERWHWSKDKVSRYIQILINLDMVKKQKRTHHATLLTLIKYDDFQNARNTDKDIDKDSDKDTDKDSNKDTDKSLLKNNKKNKNEKEEPAAPLPSEDPDDGYPRVVLDEDDDGPWYTGAELLEMSKKGLI